MAGSFTSSISLFRKVTAERVDTACVSLTRALFVDIINMTPVSPGRDGMKISDNPGQLVNNWNFSINTPNFTTTTRAAPSRVGPKRRLSQTVKKGVFLNVDNVVCMANGLHYAWNAEYDGWVRGENYWPPYRMVAKGLQNWGMGKYKFASSGKILLPV